MASIKKNALYNSAYQVIRLIFPIITYPYVSRIIGPSGIGQVSYAQTIVSYFVTFILLGIPLYASREISISRNVPGKIDKVFSEILVLSFLLTMIGFVIYSGLYFVFPELTAGSLLHWSFGLILLFSWARIDWFYRGIEEYRYITIRNLIIRIISAALIFVVIHKQQHYYRYGFLWIGESVVACVLNLIVSFRYIKLNLRKIKIMHHLKACLPSAFITSSSMLYSVLDTVMLGSMLQDGRYSVGLYTVSGRVMRIAMAIVLAGNAVITPRISLKNKEGDLNYVIKLLRKNLNFTLYFSLPIVLGLIITSDELIVLFAGDKFIPAILTMRIIAPELLLMAISSIFGQQMLFARGHDKKVLYTNIFVLVIAFITNYLFIPLYQQNGAAGATLFSRFIEMLLLAYFSRDLLLKTFDKKTTNKILMLNIVWFLSLYLIKIQVNGFSNVIVFIITVVIGVIIYGVLSLILKIEPALEIIEWGKKLYIKKSRKRKS